MKTTFDKTRVHGGGADDVKLNKEIIRKYEDPEYAKAAEEYEKMARSGRRASRKSRGKNKEKVRHRARSLAQAEQEYARPVRQEPEAEYQIWEEAEYGSEPAYQGKSRGGHKGIKAFLIILLILIALILGYFFYLIMHLDRVNTSENQFAIDSGVAEELKGYRNIAILGSDARSDEPLDGSRTDAIIILSIKKSNGDAQMISVMRDSYLQMENESGSLVLDKLTHAHHYGGGTDTCAALNRSLDLNIREFVIFDWQAVADMVDTLGGVEVDVKKNELADLNKWGPETAENVGKEWKPVTETGRQTIDGTQATTYCRIRKTSGGDTGRGDRYKKIMAAVMKKAVSSPQKLGTLSREVFPQVRTNMSQAGLLTALVRAPGYDIKKSYGWPKDYYGGLLSNGIWYAVPTSLESNVVWLHKKAFGQKNYSVSDTCRQISEAIQYETGLY